MNGLAARSHNSSDHANGSAPSVRCRLPGTALLLCLWAVCQAQPAIAQPAIAFLGNGSSEAPTNDRLSPVTPASYWQPNQSGPLLLESGGDPMMMSEPSTIWQSPHGNAFTPMDPESGAACPDCGMPGEHMCMGHGLLHPFLFSPFAPAPDRHRGVGGPLLRESWLYRPYSLGWFMGFMQGAPLLTDWIGQNQGYFGGYRLGWDFDHYWGCETRMGWASLTVYDTARAIETQQQDDIARGIGPTDSFSDRFDHRRDSEHFLWDASFLYYPWGDAAWRPYWSLGLGLAHFGFVDRMSQSYRKNFLSMPIGLGVKYRHSDRLVLRMEMTDNIAIGGGSQVRTQHNFSLTSGVELRFGGTRKAYWPHNPSRVYW